MRTRIFLGVLGGPLANLAAAVLAVQFLFLKPDSMGEIHEYGYWFVWFAGINFFLFI